MIIGIAGGLPLAIITLFFKTKSLKVIGAILVIGFNGICLYIALTKAAILGIAKSNDWAFIYIVGVIQDIFFS